LKRGKGEDENQKKKRESRSSTHELEKKKTYADFRLGRGRKKSPIHKGTRS